jgi:hypothetical protein
MATHLRGMGLPLILSVFLSLDVAANYESNIYKAEAMYTEFEYI